MNSMRRLWCLGSISLAGAIAIAGAPGCGSSDGASKSSSAQAHGPGAQARGPDGGLIAEGDGGAGTGTRSDAGGVTGTGTVPAGTLDMGGPVPDSAGLPSLPLMNHVVATVHGNSASISFDAVAGAKDYRVYVLPQKSDIRLAADGSLDGINNATYRCAGDRASPGIWVDSDHAGFGMAVPDWVAVTTYVDNETVEGYKRSLAGATIGYGFGDPTAGTVPIYAVGDPAATADNYGTGIREQQTRAKLYVQDNSTYLAKAWRDDGIAFYAPSSATSTACGSGTPVAVYEKDYTDSGTSHIYFPAGPEATSRKATGTPAFYLCPQQTGAAAPVMRVNYDIVSPGGTYGGEEDHDELLLGQEAFNRARCQASNTGVCATASQVNWSVHWGGITASTPLIVEALDAGCPFQGLLGAVSIAPTLVNGDDNNGNTTLMNDPISTFAQLQAAAPHGEVFLNGTFDGNPTPHPIARALVTVQPEVRPAMDFASDFASKPETFTESFSGGDPDCGYTTSLQTLAMDMTGCYEDHHFSSPTYDVLLFNMQDNRYGVGMTQGELWTDFTADTAGKFRITPKNVRATMSDTTFVHAVLEVTAFSTGRRYPQIMISEQDFMTSQWLLERSSDNLNATNPNSGATLIVQPFDADIGRHVVELELCRAPELAGQRPVPLVPARKDRPAQRERPRPERASPGHVRPAARRPIRALRRLRVDPEGVRLRGLAALCVRRSRPPQHGLERKGDRAHARAAQGGPGDGGLGRRGLPRGPGDRLLQHLQPVPPQSLALRVGPPLRLHRVQERRARPGVGRDAVPVHHADVPGRKRGHADSGNGQLRCGRWRASFRRSVRFSRGAEAAPRVRLPTARIRR